MTQNGQSNSNSQPSDQADNNPSHQTDQKPEETVAGRTWPDIINRVFDMFGAYRTFIMCSLLFVGIFFSLEYWTSYKLGFLEDMLEATRSQATEMSTHINASTTNLVNLQSGILTELQVRIKTIDILASKNNKLTAELGQYENKLDEIERDLTNKNENIKLLEENQAGLQEQIKGFEKKIDTSYADLNKEKLNLKKQEELSAKYYENLRYLTDIFKNQNDILNMLSGPEQVKVREIIGEVAPVTKESAKKWLQAFANNPKNENILNNCVLSKVTADFLRAIISEDAQAAGKDKIFKIWLRNDDQTGEGDYLGVVTSDLYYFQGIIDISVKRGNDFNVSYFWRRVLVKIYKEGNLAEFGYFLVDIGSWGDKLYFNSYTLADNTPEKDTYSLTDLWSYYAYSEYRPWNKSIADSQSEPVIKPMSYNSFMNEYGKDYQTQVSENRYSSYGFDPAMNQYKNFKQFSEQKLDAIDFGSINAEKMFKELLTACGKADIEKASKIINNAKGKDFLGRLGAAVINPNVSIYPHTKFLSGAVEYILEVKSPSTSNQTFSNFKLSIVHDLEKNEFRFVELLTYT